MSKIFRFHGVRAYPYSSTLRPVENLELDTCFVCSSYNLSKRIKEVEIYSPPATLPINPSNASTSRTKVPLPTPPIEGLQDSSPTVSNFCVKRSVRAPVRAAPAAASHPACPPPITQTVKGKYEFSTSIS